MTMPGQCISRREAPRSPDRLGRTARCAAMVFILQVAVADAQTVTVPGNYPTIQSAINAVLSGAQPDGTTIQVAAGTYNEALLIADSSRSLSLVGLGGAAGTIVNAGGSGQSALRVIRASGTINIQELSFRNGTGVVTAGGGFTFEDTSPNLLGVVFENNTGVDSGGGVMSRSHPRFSNCVIRNNTAQRFGGGLTISAGSRPTFSGCQIHNNVSGTGGAGLGSIGSGGGVHVNDASPTFRGCLIANNQSKFAGGGIFHLGVFGSPNGPAVLMLEDTEVSNNTTSRFSAADNPAEGGGVHIEDNAVGYLVRARILANTANTSGGLSTYRARFEVHSSVIEGNHAQDPQQIGGFGGGIGLSGNNLEMPLRQQGSLVLVDSVVRGNDARAGGGIFASGDQHCGSPTPSCNPATAPRASVTVTDSLIDANSAGVLGGGMRIDRTDLTIANSHIIGNSVSNSGTSYGGGLLLALGTSATISNATIAGNAAVNFGGGLFIDDNAVVSISDSRVYRNTAGSGGGLYVGGIGPPSGTIVDTTIADNSTHQIHEQACSPPGTPILTYTNNVITPRSGFSDLYQPTCGPPVTSITTFNDLPRTSGNTATAPSFRTFLATPDVAPAYLSWVVSRATAVSISGSAFGGDMGSVLVNPAATTTYTLTNTGGPGGSSTATVIVARGWGVSTDTPLTADFDGDGLRDLAVYRGSTGQWFVSGSAGSLFISQTWGAPAFGDVPVPADYDGDGRDDLAVFRTANGQWFVQLSNGGFLVVFWGAPAFGDTPVPADYDGDGRADLAVYRRTTGQWLMFLSSGGNFVANWGVPSAGDVPVPADYNGDGKTDVAVYRTTTGQWFVAMSNGTFFQIGWGAPSLGDTPAPADYDGDGSADIAIVRQSTGDWFINRSSGGLTVTRWGVGDARVPGNFLGGAAAEIAIWRAATGTWLIQP
jgi:parallel beta-helix repeat protein